MLMLIQAETADGRDLLCFLPAKFNKKLWIKRGGFIVVEEGDTDTEDKVTATIVTVLYEQDVKALKKLDGVWCASLIGLCSLIAASCIREQPHQIPRFILAFVLLQYRFVSQVTISTVSLNAGRLHLMQRLQHIPM